MLFLSRRKLLIVLIVTAIVLSITISGLYILFNSKALEEKVLDYQNKFIETSRKSIDLTSVHSTINVDEKVVKNSISRFINYIRELYGVNYSLKKIIFNPYAKVISVPVYPVSLYNVYVEAIDPRDNSTASLYVAIEDDRGRVAGFNLPSLILRNLGECNITNIRVNRSFLKNLVRELLISLNYTIDDNVGIELVDVKTMGFVKIVFAIKIYDALFYDPLTTPRINLVVFDPCTWKPTSLSFNPTPIILYEKGLLKPMKEKINVAEARVIAIDYLKTCIEARGSSLLQYKITTVNKTWYYIDVDEDNVIDHLSMGYLFTVEVVETTYKRGFLGIPVEQTRNKYIICIVVDIETGAPTYYFGDRTWFKGCTSSYVP